MSCFIRKNNSVVFTNEESEKDCCPICGAELDFGFCVRDPQSLMERWRCPCCKTQGSKISRVWFERHEVNASSIPEQERLALTSNRAACLNGEIFAGCLVLSTIESGLPCMPGIVTAVEEAEVPTDGYTQNAADVHVDFTGEYPPKRISDIETRFAATTGYFRPFGKLGLSDQLVRSDHLLCLEDVSDCDLIQLLESEENAIRHSYQLLYDLLVKRDATKTIDP